MKALIEELNSDYRKFDESNLQYSFSSRLLSPVLRIDNVNGKYSASLGANVKKGNDISFIPSLSPLHNWVLDKERIKPLPYDAPTIVHDALADDDIYDLKFQTVLLLYREGMDDIEIEIAPGIIEKAKTR